MAKLNADLSDLILDLLRHTAPVSSKVIHESLDKSIGYATIKRAISKLLADRLIATKGKGKSTVYFLSPVYSLLRPISTDQYFRNEIDDREIISGFNQTLISEVLPLVSIFTSTEMKFLEGLQNIFEKNKSDLSEAEYKSEFERLAIDLSWKSSQIEGNTYSLLETERLLREHETASGKTKDEAVMLLNHKATLDFILQHPNYLLPMAISAIEDVHSMLIKDLNVARNIRNRRVGISGTNYTPLDNEFLIKEALTDVCNLINEKDNAFEQALLALVLISYIQPFADGNKRTARIVSNAVLMHHKFCPISFRTVDSIEYKKAMLIFYEQNNISAFKKIFIEQFEFAVKTYF